MNTQPLNLIGITDLRSRTREVLDKMKESKTPVIIVRESVPEAVMIPYEEFFQWEEEKRRRWNERLDALIVSARPKAESWLKKKGYNPAKVTGDQVLDILENDDKKTRA